MEPSDYKHVALGLIFLKYISDAFEAKRSELLKEELADAENPARTRMKIDRAVIFARNTVMAVIC